MSTFVSGLDFFCQAGILLREAGHSRWRPHFRVQVTSKSAPNSVPATLQILRDGVIQVVKLPLFYTVSRSLIQSPVLRSAYLDYRTCQDVHAGGERALGQLGLWCKSQARELVESSPCQNLEYIATLVLLDVLLSCLNCSFSIRSATMKGFLPL
jgi:hypothetical protein